MTTDTTAQAVRHDWENGFIDWETAMRRLLVVMPEAQANDLMRTWAAEAGREIGS